MKKLLAVIIVFCAATLVLTQPGWPRNGTFRVVMELTGLTWNLCSLAVKRSLEGVEGVEEAEVSHKENKAWVIVDGRVTDEMLLDAVARAGRFTGKIISREPVEPSPGSQT